MTPEIIREGPGRYRIGDFCITQESARRWRDWWWKAEDAGKPFAGCLMDSFNTLREARAHVEEEIAAELASAAALKR